MKSAEETSAHAFGSYEATLDNLRKKGFEHIEGDNDRLVRHSVWEHSDGTKIGVTGLKKQHSDEGIVRVRLLK